MGNDNGIVMCSATLQAAGDTALSRLTSASRLAQFGLLPAVPEPYYRNPLGLPSRRL